MRSKPSPSTRLFVASLLVLSAASGVHAATHVNIVPASGDSLSVVAGQTMAHPFSARVTRDNGTPVADAVVAFIVRSCGSYAHDNYIPPCQDPLLYGQLVGSNTAVSNADGVAASAPLLAGSLQGSYAVAAVFPQMTQTVHAEALTDTPLTHSNQFTVQQQAPALELGGYMSGNWYDQTQAGQGLQLEFTYAPDELIAIWFSFTPDGSGQSWIYAQGPYDRTGNSVLLHAKIFGGAKFPPLFQSGSVQATDWGLLEFAFTDCDHGTLTWSSDLPDYGSGMMPLSRLTRIGGTSCP